MLKNKEIKQFLIDWMIKFEDCLKTKNNYKEYFYALNKALIKHPEKGGNLNKRILKEVNDGKGGTRTIVNVEKSFIILDEKNFQKIKKLYPEEIFIKVEGFFKNKKCIIKIDDKIYYFYYINELKNVEEGYFIFEIEDSINIILQDFKDSEINEFFRKLKIIDFFRKQKVIYNGISFQFHVKGLGEIGNNTQKDQRINNFNQSNKKKSNHNDIKNQNIFNNYDKNNDNNPRKIFNIKNMNQDNESDKISLKIYKCAYYYYTFSNSFKSKLNNNIDETKMNLYLIDNNWMNNFKNKCNYELIKDKLNEKDSGCDIFATVFRNKHPLNAVFLECKPIPPSKHEINVNEWYYEGYEFLDEESLNEFLKVFSIVNKNCFKNHEVILKNKIIIVIYDNNNLEVINNYGEKHRKEERFLFSVKKKDDLEILIKAFLTKGYNNAFNVFNINIENEKTITEKELIYNNNAFGKILNISLMNKNSMPNCSSESHFIKKNNDSKGIKDDNIITSNNETQKDEIAEKKTKSNSLKNRISSNGFGINNDRKTIKYKLKNKIDINNFSDDGKSNQSEKGENISNYDIKNKMSQKRPLSHDIKSKQETNQKRHFNFNQNKNNKNDKEMESLLKPLNINDNNERNECKMFSDGIKDDNYKKDENFNNEQNNSTLKEINKYKRGHSVDFSRNNIIENNIEGNINNLNNFNIKKNDYHMKIGREIINNKHLNEKFNKENNNIIHREGRYQSENNQEEKKNYLEESKNKKKIIIIILIISKLLKI